MASSGLVLPFPQGYAKRQNSDYKQQGYDASPGLPIDSVAAEARDNNNKNNADEPLH
jgi:hypothetical protein